MNASRCLVGLLMLGGCQPAVDRSAGGGGASSTNGGASASGSSNGGANANGGASAASNGGAAGAAAGASSACTGPGALQAIWPLPSVTPSSLAVDPQGNVYVAGAFTDPALFGTHALTSAGMGDIFLAKYDSNGAVLFAVRFGNSADDDPAPALAVDASGNAYLTGFFSSTLDFGGGTKQLVAIGVDAFAIKVSPNGQTLWAQHFGYNGGPYDIGSVSVEPQGDLVVAGTSRGPITLGSKTWPETATAAQPFIAKLSSADGSVVWSAAAGGDFDTGKVHVAVDATGRSFLVGEALSGSGAWGGEPPASVGFFCTFRVGFDAAGEALWSQFDLNGLPVSASVDASGRLAVVEYTGSSPTPPTVGSKVFDVQVDTTLSLLLSPVDGTLLSGEAFATSTFPWAATVDGSGSTLVTGQYGSGSLTVGGSVLGSPGPVPNNEALFVAALDGASKPEGAQRLGAAGNTQPYAIAVAPDSGRVLVAATNDTAFSGASGTVQPGTFLAVFGPNACADNAGPLGPATGSASDHGDLPDGSVSNPSDAGAAACPATMALATNGAACPVAMGCSYDSTCCFCVPTACGNEPTTWTCNSLANQSASCPASAPDPGGTCPAGAQCNYCLPGGRFFADCTAGGWSTGYAQLLCN